MGMNAPADKEMGKVGAESLALDKNLKELEEITKQIGATFSPVIRQEPMASDSEAAGKLGQAPNSDSPFGTKLAGYNARLKEQCWILLSYIRSSDL